MSATDVHDTIRDASVGRVDMKLEVMIIPVSDVDRSKEFYERLGWNLDRDLAPMEGLRIVQFTPPGSGTSVTFGPGTHDGRARLGRGGTGPFRRDQARSKRSAFITLVHAITKSFTNFSFASAHA
jgi:catechol 2,3-dioxygenase-like lactoylglutathione lyase family enzyme